MFEAAQVLASNTIRTSMSVRFGAWWVAWQAPQLYAFFVFAFIASYLLIYVSGGGGAFYGWLLFFVGVATVACLVIAGIFLLIECVPGTSSCTTCPFCLIPTDPDDESGRWVMTFALISYGVMIGLTALSVGVLLAAASSADKQARALSDADDAAAPLLKRAAFGRGPALAQFLYKRK